MDNQDGTGQHIWLRYATQYTKDDRIHTIEMGIPVPLGASVEKREQLLREAEIGMSQLIQHVEERVFQALERVQSSHTATDQGATIPLPQLSPPSPAPKVVSAVSSSSALDQPPPMQARPVNKPASVPAPQTATQPPKVQRTPSRAAPPAAQAVEVPPTRHSVGASMPSSLGPTSTRVNLTIPDFLSYVRENMHLSSKQAMDLLQVKSLAGINLREALEKLKQLGPQNPQSETSIPQQPQQQASVVREARPGVSEPVSHNTPSPLPSQSTASMRQDVAVDELPTRSPDEALGDSEQERTLNVIEMRVPPPVQPARGFDEEEELEDLDGPGDDLSVVPEISPEQLSRARDKISALRQWQGAVVTSAARLQVLRNAADDEVSTQQLQELVAGVWHIPSLQKLKKDQVEALISWAKEDDFLHEVNAVLVVLEEERYARGNR